MTGIRFALPKSLIKISKLLIGQVPLIWRCLAALRSTAVTQGGRRDGTGTGTGPVGDHSAPCMVPVPTVARSVGPGWVTSSSKRHSPGREAQQAVLVRGHEYANGTQTCKLSKQRIVKNNHEYDYGKHHNGLNCTS